MEHRRIIDMTPGPPAKRARTVSRGDDDYRPGSIVEIEVQNFMTYTYLKSRPGPRLNLIVGPNGTGKSTLVCAICLGLAGEAQLLGRAGHIGEFVKRGEDSGWIRISLRGGSPNEVLFITRKINKRNKSEWFLNDQSVTMRAVQEKMQKFNIQLDNLTQFLPQDRVCEFAKLSPVQLLEETEKAVGNPELSAKHQMLIQKSEEMKKIKTALTSHETQLAHVVASNAELEEDKQRMHQRTQLLEKAAMMKKKLPWLKYEERKGTFEQAKEAESVAKTKMQDLQGQSKDLKLLFEPLKARKDIAKGASERLQMVKMQNEQKLRESADHETELSAKVKAKFVEIQDVHKKEALLQARVEKAHKAVSDAAADLENLPEFKPQTETIKNLKAQLEELRMEEADKRSQIQDKENFLLQRRRDYDQCNRRLQDINTVNTRLLEALRNSGAHQIIQAYEWVQSHRDQFRKQVFGPILLEVRVANKEYAKYVEGHVPNYIWKAFISQDVEDRDLLVKNLKQFDVPVINQRTGQPRHAPRVTPAMMQLGITTRLDEVIEAPAVVKTLLIGQTGLDYSFIGTSETNQRADQALRVGVKDLWTPENHYKWSGSRYGSHNSNDISAVRPSRLFSENVDLREKNELENRKAQLEGEMRRSEGEKSELNLQYRLSQEEAAKLDKQIDDIFHQGRQQKKRIVEAKNILEQRMKKLSALQNEEGSTDAENRLRALIKQINADRVQNLITLKERLMETAKTQTSYAAQHLQAIELDAKARELEKDVRKQDLVVREAAVFWGQCKQVTENFRTQLALAKDFAEQIATLTPELQQKFAEMPDAVQDLENAIADCEAQAAAVICNNENAILIYEQRCEQIRNLSLKAEERRTALNRCMKEIESIKSTWLPELRELVCNINENFSQNFKEIAVAGEVSLDEHGTDFDQYGILIKVKFRESANLQVLSAHHQSGGERSVSTILYLVSLQGLTYCPFRVVDEINQGMDPKNERKMFQQLVRAASQLNTPQCLLLTPKLLPDLNYTAACTILNIMNGPYVEEASTNWRNGPTWSAMSQMVRSQS